LHKTKEYNIRYLGIIKYHLQQDTGIETVGTIIVVDVYANSVKILQRTVNSRIKRKSKVFVQSLVTGLYIKVQVLVTLPHYTTVCVQVLRSNHNAITSICIIPTFWDELWVILNFRHFQSLIFKRKKGLIDAFDADYTFMI